MSDRELELVVTRENGEIKKVRIRRGSEYIFEMLPYLDKYGDIELKNLGNNMIIGTTFNFRHPYLCDLVEPTEELLTDIRTNFLKMKPTSSNCHISVFNNTVILDRSKDIYIIGTIKFFNEHIEHTAQEYFNNRADGLRNDGDLMLSLNREGKNDNLLYLYNTDGTKVLDVCGINEFEIGAMLSDEKGKSIASSSMIKELIYLIYSKRRLSLVEYGGCMLGNYILDLKKTRR